MLTQIQAGRKPRARTGQHHRRLRMITLQHVERIM
jgi:hypothetical protein